MPWRASNINYVFAIEVEMDVDFDFVVTEELSVANELAVAN